MMTKKVLITGGMGFIGSHLCDALLKEGHDVIILDDLSSSSTTNLSAKNLERITFIKASVFDIHDHRDALKGVNHIFHLAALISGYDSLNEPDAYIDLNIRALMRILELARDLGDVKLSFASSSTVYGNGTAHIRSESLVPEPMTMYALSKLAGEHMLEMYHQLYKFDYVALRLFNVYGPRQNPTHPYANVTCKFSQAAALGMPIKLYGDGKQTRDFIYVGDVVTAFMATMQPTPQRLYNVGTASDHSIKHLIDVLEELSGKPFDVTQCEEWPNDIRQIRADITRITTDLDWKATTELSDGLARTVAYFDEQPKS
jgi:UDP-glucose 4-epimerase